MLYKKLEHRSQRPATYECHFDDICECFLQRSGGYLLRKCTTFMVKKLPCISQGMQKTYLINKFFKIFKNCVPLCVFFLELCKLCNFASFHNSGSHVQSRAVGFKFSPPKDSNLGGCLSKIETCMICMQNDTNHIKIFWKKLHQRIIY